MESKANKNGGGENMSLFSQMEKGKGKDSSKGKGKDEESNSQP